MLSPIEYDNLECSDNWVNDIKSLNDCNGIDCGTNEELFLVIAALRDDSNYMQWFITDFILSVSYDDSIGNDHYFTDPKGIMFFWDENWDNATIKHENRLSMISGFILFIDILGSIILLIMGIVESSSYRSNGYGWIYIFLSIAVLLSAFLFHSFFIVIKEISVSIKKNNISPIPKINDEKTPPTQSNVKSDHPDCLSQWK